MYSCKKGLLPLVVTACCYRLCLLCRAISFSSFLKIFPDCKTDQRCFPLLSGIIIWEWFQSYTRIYDRVLLASPRREAPPPPPNSTELTLVYVYWFRRLFFFFFRHAVRLLLLLFPSSSLFFWFVCGILPRVRADLQAARRNDRRQRAGEGDGVREGCSEGRRGPHQDRERQSECPPEILVTPAILR